MIFQSTFGKRIFAVSQSHTVCTITFPLKYFFLYQLFVMIKKKIFKRKVNNDWVNEWMVRIEWVYGIKCFRDGYFIVFIGMVEDVYSAVYSFEYWNLRMS